ncbi:MAG: hypothetical protein N2484_00285 [Clostridia bacterium]|nr:hypothetical protein [Clostridia bacterium]
MIPLKSLDKFLPERDDYTDVVVAATVQGCIIGGNSGGSLHSV